MNDTMHINDTIVVEIDIDAPPERVFQAWIDPRQRLAWWGDDATYRGTKMESDLRVGGKWRTEGKSTQGKPFTVSGQYTRVEPPTALGFTWNHDWGQSGLPETHVLIELTANLLRHPRDAHPLRIHEHVRARRPQPGMAAGARLVALLPRAP